MKEKKIFILAVPTIIVIIIFIIGVSAIFYNRNFKKMSRDDVKSLAQKVALIDNISCEIVTKSSEDSVSDVISDYKLKDDKLISEIGSFRIYDNKNEQVLIQIDDAEKKAYVYSEYNSEIDDFRAMICSAEKLIENDSFEYEFKEYTTVNGIKCVNFVLKSSDVSYNIWLDRSSGMIVEMKCEFFSESGEDISNTLYFRYQLDSVADDIVKKPDLSGYEIIEL